MNSIQKSLQASAQVILALSAIITSSAPTAIAQSQASAVSNPSVQSSAKLAPSRPLRRYTGTQNYMYDTEALKSPVSAANLPNYQGSANFSGGLNYPKLKTGQCFLMRFLSKDRPYQVMKSYRNTLLQYGWQINERQTNSKQLTAVMPKDGLHVTFCVFPCSKDSYNCSFEIKYLATGQMLTNAP